MRFPSLSASAAALTAILFLTGCSLTPTAKPTDVAGLALRGNVHGGQQPIVGAHVYLLAAGTSGYGSASTSLLTTGVDGTDSVGGYVLTDAAGSFSVGGTYTCTPGTQVYLYSLGGDPGAGPNSAASLMSVLGNCPSAGNFATAVPFLWVNEVSTVAAAYAMAAFATDALHVGSSGTALARTGIANAFANTTNLSDVASGAALTTTPAGNGAVPKTTINTLANILASCVNTTGPASASCTTLFSSAQSNGSSGTPPTETATAAINIAHNPATNVAALFGIPAPISAFAPALSSQPDDFTLTLAFTGGGLNQPSSIVFDAAGDAWVQGYGNFSRFGPLGNAISGAGGYTDPSLNNPQGLTVDSSGNLWMANYSSSTLSHFDANGAFLNTVSNVSFSAPTSIAIDPSGNLWVSNFAGDSVTELTSAGVNIATFTGSGLYHPFQVVADASGNLWLPNPNNGDVARFTGAGGDVNSPYFASGLTAASSNLSSAIDAAGNFWTVNYNGSLSALTPTGTALAGTPYSAGAYGTGAGSPLAIDGQSNLWAAISYLDTSTFPFVQSYRLLGRTNAGVSILNQSLPSPASAVAFDGSGNLWMALHDQNQIAEIVGIAAPVVTPIAAGVAGGTIATRP